MFNAVKKTLKNIPVLGSVLIKIHSLLRPNKLSFTTSQEYWEKRYQVGMTSGSGSYGRLAEFKADFLNDFVQKNKIDSVIEFGCGDGNQLTLANYPTYLGMDVSDKAISLCKKKFNKKESYTFLNTNTTDPREGSFDLALSLDVIYHLIEDDVFETYMRRLFKSSNRYVIIYAYDFDKKYSTLPVHEMGRNFTIWIEKNVAQDWELIEVIKNAYPYKANDPDNTSQSDFFVYKRCTS